MCTAYKVGKRGSVPAEAFFEQAHDYIMGIATPRIVRPTHKAPVILPDGTLHEMEWGFRRKVPAAKTKTRWQTIVNSREDKLDGRTWSKAFRERRCLIPAFSFFEWVARGGANVPLEFQSPTDTLLWIAGLWETDPERGDVFSMITTEPNTAVAPVHDRMPAVLLPEHIQPFLQGEMNTFGPSLAPLIYSEAENFLKRKPAAAKAASPPSPPPEQGTLF